MPENPYKSPHAEGIVPPPIRLTRIVRGAFLGAALFSGLVLGVAVIWYGIVFLRDPTLYDPVNRTFAFKPISELVAAFLRGASRFGMIGALFGAALAAVQSHSGNAQDSRVSTQRAERNVHLHAA